MSALLNLLQGGHRKSFENYGTNAWAFAYNFNNQSINLVKYKELFCVIKKKVDNSSYIVSIDIGASLLKQVIWFMVHGLFFLNPLFAMSFVKVKLLRLFGAVVGRGVVIKPSVHIKISLEN